MSAPGTWRQIASGRLDISHGDLTRAAIFLGIEGNLLALVQRAHASALERGGMDEYVLAAVIGLNEAEALLVIVEFDCAGLHTSVSFV